MLALLNFPPLVTSPVRVSLPIDYFNRSSCHSGSPIDTHSYQPFRCSVLITNFVFDKCDRVSNIQSFFWIIAIVLLIHQSIISTIAICVPNHQSINSILAIVVLISYRKFVPHLNYMASHIDMIIV